MDYHDPNIFRILELIELQTNRKIVSINDARLLSNEMLEKKVTISPHTIARLFGVIKPYRKPYRYTLDGLARFLGFSDWKDFHQTSYRQVPATDLIVSQNQSGFSLSRLEVAILTKNPLEIVCELERFDEERYSTQLYEIASKLVHFIRNEDKESGLLKELAGIENGHKLFYEFFVDEDDPEAYYSNALRQYYLPGLESPARKLFVITYLVIQDAYKQNRMAPQIAELDGLQKQIDLRKLHFQELSRYIECLIIRDGFGGTLHKTISGHIQQILSFCAKKSSHDASWILYRSIRAMVFFGLWDKIMEDIALGLLFEKTLKKVNIRNATTADFAVQLFYLARCRFFTSDYKHQPFKLQSHYLHFDSNERQSMEIATACLLSKGDDNAFYRKNLLQYCCANASTWVCKLLL